MGGSCGYIGIFPDRNRWTKLKNTRTLVQILSNGENAVVPARPPRFPDMVTGHLPGQVPIINRPWTTKGAPLGGGTIREYEDICPKFGNPPNKTANLKKRIKNF